MTLNVTVYALNASIDLVEMVAALGEVTALTLPFLRSRMLKHSTGRRILRERPLITDKSLDAAGLHTLAPSTFGGAYYQFMRSNNFNADSRAPVLALSLATNTPRSSISRTQSLHTSCCVIVKRTTLAMF
jgi:ubiquinone biosynthesis protein Coq4